MSNQIKIIAEDANKITMLDYFDGQPVHFYFDKITQEVYIDANDVAACLGYANHHEMIGSDEGLDAILDYQKSHPGVPFLTKPEDIQHSINETTNTMQVLKEPMTVRQFIKSMEGAPDEALDQPMRIYFAARGQGGGTVQYSNEVLKPLYFNEDVYIGPDGIFKERDVKSMSLEPSTDETPQEYIDSYNLYIPKFQVMLQIDRDPNGATDLPESDLKL